MSAQGIFAMPYHPDSRVVNIHEEVCRSTPLSPDDTLVEVFEILMQHPTLPNLDKTEQIMRALKHPFLHEFARETCETRTALFGAIKKNLPVLLEHLPANDKFEYRQDHTGQWVFVRLIDVSTSLEGRITKLSNSQVTKLLTMCQDIISHIKARINDQTWQLHCWECMPGRYNRYHPQWRRGNGDADIQTALALSAADALRAPAAAIAPAAYTDDHFGSDNDDPNIQAAIIASLSKEPAAAPVARTDHHFGSDENDADMQAAINASLSDQPAADPVSVSPAAPAAVSRTCLVCFEETDDDLLAITPCGHKCVCDVCAPKLVITKQRCPVCRGKITRCIRIFECGRL